MNRISAKLLKIQPVLFVLLISIMLPAMAESGGSRGFCRYGQTFLIWPESSMAVKGYVISRASGSNWIPVAKVPQGSGVDILAQRMAADENRTEPVHGYRIEPGKPYLPKGTGLWVHTVTNSGPVIYRVTVWGGKEICRVKVLEHVGNPQPIPEGTRRLSDGRVFRTYIHWATPSLCHLDGTPFKFAVQMNSSIQTKNPSPLIVSLHAYGHGMKPTNWTEKTAITLIPDDNTNGMPFKSNAWWFGYSDQIGGNLRESVIENYTERRLLYTIKWVRANYSIDPNRIYIRGISMGGTGAISFGMRHPEIFAAIDAMVPQVNPSYKDLGWSLDKLESIWGKREWRLRTLDGQSVWDRQNMTAYVKNHPEDLPFLKVISGKGDHLIQWGQIPPFFKMLQESRHGFCAFWGTGGHDDSQTGAPKEYSRFSTYKIRRNESYPAIYNLSVNSNPGDGSYISGDPSGFMNAGFDWKILKDSANEWKVLLTPVDPKVKHCSLDLTPRRLQVFKIKPKSRHLYKNLDAKTNALIQTGPLTADSHGLLTIKNINISQNGNKIQIF